jgi:hypothetical protein
MNALTHLVGYLKRTKDHSLTLGRVGYVLHIFIDSSHGSYADGRGQAGVVITMGKGAIYASSKKHDLAPRSSTDSEIIALSMYIDKGLKVSEQAKELVGNEVPVVIHEDNMPVVQLLQGSDGSFRNKALRVRVGYLRSVLKDLIVKYTPTELMLADGLTKSLVGKKLKEFCVGVLGEGQNDRFNITAAKQNSKKHGAHGTQRATKQN